MIWKEEVDLIAGVMERIKNLDKDIELKVVQLESRKVTLENKIFDLEAEQMAMEIKNEEIKKALKNSMKMDLENLEEGKRRVVTKEVNLLAKEKELNKLKEEMQAEIESSKKMRRAYAGK